MLPKSYQQTQVKKFASTDQTPLSYTNKHHYKISIQKQLPLITITRLFILFTVRMCKYNNSLINKVLVLLQYWPKAKRITASIIIINKLCYQHPRTSLFYLLLYIHKANYPGRPISSAISCSTSQIATYLDYLLTSLVKPQPTYIKDSKGALRVIKDFRFTGSHRFSFTMDIKSLYTIIHAMMAYLLLSISLTNAHNNIHLATNTLIRLATLLSLFLKNKHIHVQQ